MTRDIKRTEAVAEKSHKLLNQLLDIAQSEINIMESLETRIDPRTLTQYMNALTNVLKQTEKDMEIMQDDLSKMTDEELQELAHKLTAKDPKP